MSAVDDDAGWEAEELAAFGILVTEALLCEGALESLLFPAGGRGDDDVIREEEEAMERLVTCVMMLLLLLPL